MSATSPTTGEPGRRLWALPDRSRAAVRAPARVRFNAPSRRQDPSDTLTAMATTLTDLDTLPDDLEALGELFKAATAHVAEVARSQPPARQMVDGHLVVVDPAAEDIEELNAARKVEQEIALRMHRIRQAAR
jgi:hypothetical protein